MIIEKLKIDVFSLPSLLTIKIVPSAKQILLYSHKCLKIRFVLKVPICSFPAYSKK